MSKRWLRMKASAVHELEISKSADAENHDSEPIEISETILSSETVDSERELLVRKNQSIKRLSGGEWSDRRRRHYRRGDSC